jgi:hypothetical protein
LSNKKYIQDIIDGLPLDQKAEGPNVELTFVNPCKGGPGTVSGNKSTRSQDYPATKQNDTVFNRFWDLAADNTDGAQFKSAERVVNGMTVFKGLAQMTSVDTQGRFYERHGKMYKVAYFGGAADWFLLLKDKELGRDLEWSGAVHNFVSPNIVGGWNATFSPVQQWAYGIIKWSDWGYEVGSDIRVEVFQSTALIQIKQTIDKIFNSIGYSISSNFFDTDVFAGYVMPVPFADKYPQEYSEAFLNIEANKTILTSVSASTIGTGIVYDTQTKFPSVGPNPFVTSTPGTILPIGNTSQYTAPDNGFYQFDFSITIANVVGSPNVNFGIITNAPGNPNGPIKIIGVPVAGQYQASTVLQLSAGDVVEFFFAASITPLSGDSFDITGGTLSVIGEATIGPGTSIDFTYLLRDWKITDFIKGITHAFNLCWETDTARGIITVEPKDDYLLPDRNAASTSLEQGFYISNTNDKQFKRDYEKQGRVTNQKDEAQTQFFRWKEDSNDPTAEFIDSQEDLPALSAQYILPDDRFKQDTETFDNPFFAATVHLFDQTITDDSSEPIISVPLIWPVNYRENPTAEDPNYEVEPRLLWFGGQRGGIDGIFKVADSSTGTVVTSEPQWPALFFVNFNDPTGLDASLSFSDITIQGNDVQGHLRRFYLRDMARKRVGKKVLEWFYFNELDIINLTFRNKIFLNGNLLILQEVQSWSPLVDRSTKSILKYDAADTEDDVNAIENSLQNGFISDFPTEE